MRVALVTSGGDAPGMNAALRAVVRRAGLEGWRVQGVRGGYDGLFSEAIRPMGSRDVANILQRGGTVLGSGRSARFRTPEGRAEAAAVLRRRGVEAMVVVGGDGSYRGMHALHAEQGIRVVGLPGTIDNDVAGTDRTIGFDTAVNTALDAVDRIRDTAFAAQRIFFVEVMGRHSGAIAAEVALAGGAEAVIVPELGVDVAALAQRIQHSVDRGKSSCIVVVAEGAHPEGAAAIAAAVREQVAFRTEMRVTVLGHTQRGGNPTAADRVLASRLGDAAIAALKDGADPCVVGVFGGELRRTPLGEALVNPPHEGDTARLADRLAGLVQQVPR